MAVSRPRTGDTHCRRVSALPNVRCRTPPKWTDTLSMPGIQGTGRHCICRHTCLRGTGLRYTTDGIGRAPRFVLFSYFCFGSLDLDWIVIVAASRAVAGLLNAYDIRAHLRTGQLVGCGLREGQCRACERADGEGKANERLHDWLSFSE